MSENPSLITARTLVATLIELGVPAVAYCPGSRNAPFAYALAQAESEGLIRVATFSDERSAGFWAVGFIKGSGAPVAVLTTSGTAVAELHAAAEEAFHQELPLLILSADRPHHMRGVGASQTTSQEGLFGPSVVAQASIPAGAVYPAETSAVLTRLTLEAKSQGGPAHLNVAFAEPLVPRGEAPLPTVTVPQMVPNSVLHPVWEDLCEPDLRTVVVAGDQADPRVLEAARLRAVPILAEPSSGACGMENWVPHAAQLLTGFAGARSIEQVVVTGNPTLTRPVAALLGNPVVRKIVCSDKRVYPDVSGTAAVLAAGVLPTAPVHAPDRSWLESWLGASGAASSIIARQVDGSLNLLSVARLLWDDPQDVDLWLAASNAVRAFDLAAAHPRTGRVFANRGLAGIDGSVASALGVAQALDRPVRAVVGDMAFAADLSSLAQRPGGDCDLQVLVLNDAGGGIFASLEHGAAPADLYERYFAVAPHVDVCAAAESCGWTATRVTTQAELQEALSLTVRGLEVIEIVIPRPAELLRETLSAVCAGLPYE